MAYSYETVRLDKGMYGEAGHSFTQVLEKCDPSEQYRGTPLEHLDAFQRQLKRFDIHVKGAGSDMVEKFFHTSDSAGWRRAPGSRRPPSAPRRTWCTSTSGGGCW